LLVHHASRNRRSEDRQEPLMSSDPSRLIAALARDRINLDLKTLDLCFLAGLYLRADRASLASFEADVLIDMFEQICDVVDPGAERPRKRATHAIQQRRDQRMLARVDGAGIVRSGEYTLTRLAAAVVEYFLADEALTRESLPLLTGTLRAQLAEILGAATRADTEDAWRERVVAPLRVTVGDLVGGIERRQRGPDSQQEAVSGRSAGRGLHRPSRPSRQLACRRRDPIVPASRTGRTCPQADDRRLCCSANAGYRPLQVATAATTGLFSS
jgi:chromosome condensin MukBEF complex kleisin-like MukF subunit